MLNQANFRLVDENVDFEISQLIAEKEDLLNKSGLLHQVLDCTKKRYKGVNISGIFCDDVWALKSKRHFSYVYIDFRGINESIIKDEKKLILLKCWIADEILTSHRRLGSEYDAKYMGAKFNQVCKFLIASKFLSVEFLDDKKGSQINDYVVNIEGQDVHVRGQLFNLLSYLDFIRLYTTEDVELIDEYRLKISSEHDALSGSSSPRDLPEGVDIMFLSYYINKFWEDDTLEEEFKLLYMPVVIWWKITTIIPMRPSEFTLKIPRDCIFEKNKKYYLKIDRIKKKNKKTLPILRELIITEDIYKMIKWYINKTDKYGESNQLCSYKAYYSLRFSKAVKVKNIEIKKVEGCRDRGINPQVQRFEKFTTGALKKMLDKFYNKVIAVIYHDNREVRRIKLGDTRHIAFTSLMLQGYSPVEIAILGGHTSLMAMDNYTCSPITYIDTQVISMTTKELEFKSTDMSRVEVVVFNMPKKPPVPLEECVEAIFGESEKEIEIGYCTANYKEKPCPCESEKCDKCSKWWCYPSEENFLKLEKIKLEEIAKKQSNISKDVKFIQKVIMESGVDVTGEHIDLTLEINKTISAISKKLKSNTKEVIHLKYSLLHELSEEYKLLTDVDELLPTKEVRKILKVQKESSEIQKVFNELKRKGEL